MWQAGNVSRDFSAQMTYPVPAEAVLKMYFDPAYVQAKAESLHGTDVVAEVSPLPGGGHRVLCSRSIPADVPAAAKPFVGERITVAEVHDWAPATPTGATGTVTVSMAGTPVSVSGTIALVDTDSGSVATLDLTVTAPVPFFGNKLEEIVADQLGAAIEYEETMGRNWLAR